MEKKSKKKIITQEDKNKISGRKAIIPEIGSRLLLEQDWEFSVHSEYRNLDIIKADGKKEPTWNSTEKPYLRTLPSGTEFLVDRIYIRNGMKDFSSVTLRITKTTDANILAAGTKRIPFKKASAKDKNSFGRFWIKLVDFNKANMIIVDDKVLVGKLKTVKGDVCTLADVKNKSKKRTMDFWVKFVDQNNKENSFEGIAHTTQAKTKYLWDLTGVQRDRYNSWVFSENPATLHDHQPYQAGATYTEVRPANFFTHAPLPNSWHRKHTKQYWEIARHPHEDLLLLTRNEDKLKEMGIISKESPLENLKLGDGLYLSLYKLVEIEVMVEEGQNNEEE